MVKEPRLDQEAVSVLIHAAERRHGITLNMEDYVFLLNSTRNFVDGFINKFVAGAVEHNEEGSKGFVESVDHQAEIESEILDLWSYHQGRKAKDQKCKQSLSTSSVETKS